MFPAFGLNNTDWRIVWDRSQVPALREDETTKHAMVCSDFEAGVIDRDEARVALGYESKAEYRGQFAVEVKAAGSDESSESIKAREFREADWRRKGGRFDGYVGPHSGNYGRVHELADEFSGSHPLNQDKREQGRRTDGHRLGGESSALQSENHGPKPTTGRQDGDFDAMHRWTGDDVPPESKEFQKSKARAARDLEPYTAQGANEASVSIRQVDGSRYAPLETGGRTRVSIAIPDDDLNEPVAIMHSHSRDITASHRDWGTFLSNRNATQSHIICPVFTYSFHKSDDWHRKYKPTKEEAEADYMKYTFDYWNECDENGVIATEEEERKFVSARMCEKYEIMSRKSARL